MPLKRFISFSGGVESTTMCVLYGKGATAIFCDTGAENKEMYERLDFCEKRLKEIHNGDFELLRIKPKVKVKGEYVDNLTDAIIGWQFMPTSFQRYCTGRFKIVPIDNFLISQGEPVELLIGFNADEEPSKDRTGSYMKAENVTYRYPLFEDDITRDDCKTILRPYDLEPNFPIYMRRGGCYYCIFKSLSEVKAYYYFDRETFDKMQDLEEKIQDKRQKFFAILSNQRSMKSIREECEQEVAFLGFEAAKATYNNINSGKQACGAFCHR